jgi:DNA-binding NtrC family response regulator
MSTQIRILVVNDEEVIREACQRILRRAGHTVDLASNGEHALKLIRRIHYDLALIDIKMPVLDGLGLMDIMRREYEDIAIVVMTGHGTSETAVQALKAGATDFLTKPFSPNELRQAVKGAIARLIEARRPENSHA